MKIYNCVMLVIATAIFLGGGIFSLIVLASEIPPVETIVSFIEHNFLWFAFGSVVFILLGLGEIFVALRNLGRVPAVAFTNPLGEVRIAYSALEDYIKGLRGEIPEIKEIKPQVVAGKRGIEIHSRIVVEKDVNLPEVTSGFQDLVSKYVKDVLGIEEIASIKVYIHKITSQKKSKVAEETM